MRLSLAIIGVAVFLVLEPYPAYAQWGTPPQPEILEISARQGAGRVLYRVKYRWEDHPDVPSWCNSHVRWALNRDGKFSYSETLQGHRTVELGTYGEDYTDFDNRFPPQPDEGDIKVFEVGVHTDVERWLEQGYPVSVLAFGTRTHTSCFEGDSDVSVVRLPRVGTITVPALPFLKWLIP